MIIRNNFQVRDCLARDEPSINMLQLTDERGCILQPKLFGALQTIAPPLYYTDITLQFQFFIININKTTVN